MRKGGGALTFRSGLGWKFPTMEKGRKMGFVGGVGRAAGRRVGDEDAVFGVCLGTRQLQPQKVVR